MNAGSKLKARLRKSVIFILRFITRKYDSWISERTVKLSGKSEKHECQKIMTIGLWLRKIGTIAA